MMQQVCQNGKIWDLHIHSCQCSSVDKITKKLSVKEYIDKICNVLKTNDLIEMISFTDHNAIHPDVYNEYYERKQDVTLLPGVEIDVALEPNDTDSKHLIIYFDAINDKNKLNQLVIDFNEIMESNAVSPKNPIYIATLLDKLVSLPNKIRFALSPHAMKQGKRGIDSNWHTLTKEEQIAQAEMYTDQFFCFWESGRSGVTHAIEYLKNMDAEINQSIVSFSDSKNINDFQNYVSCPPMYFHALANFNGLVMTGSEILRISKTPEIIDDREKGKFIGRIKIGDQQITLSPKMNAIIGGRGSGKSILLDSLALQLSNNLTIDRKRKKFLSTRMPIVFDLHNSTISSNFKFDYFNQNYIASLFSQEKGIEDYFKEGFDQVEKINPNDYLLELKEKFKTFLSSEILPASEENIIGLTEKYVVENNDSLNIKLGRELEINKQLSLDEFEYPLYYDKIVTNIQKVLPESLKNDPEVAKAIKELTVKIVNIAYKKRIEFLSGISLKNKMISNFNEKKSQLSSVQQSRTKIIKTFTQELNKKLESYTDRVNIINAYILMTEHMSKTYNLVDDNFVKITNAYFDGENPKVFEFSYSLEMESPLHKMISIFKEALTIDRQIGECTYSNLWNYIEAFCFNTATYKNNETAESVLQKLRNLDVNVTNVPRIAYKSKNSSVFQDISSLSPGSQTNILLEYIVHKDIERPLLIDQPEDNVDNQTIYRDIKKWFITLKNKRQVIVVTHDANIVINADAENVIIAEHQTDNRFTYHSGALEYSDTINSASKILDGGKEAVKRRLIKYGC